MKKAIVTFVTFVMFVGREDRRQKIHRNRRHFSSVWVATAVSSLLLVLGAVMPDSSYAAEARTIEEVLVTAERREASIQDTSISITALTGDFLDDFGIRNQEDLQNFVPATTIQPYDATIRGVGRNFRALGGDPGVATYMNGVYSEDLLTATAATFWDVERIEVLRGPQGTLYGRNAVGGAMNILYKKPTDYFEGAVRAIAGNFGTQEYYGAFSGPLIQDKLSGRINFSLRDRDGFIEEIGKGEDIDGLGTRNIAAQFQWNPTDTLTVDFRQNWMTIDRSFGGGNGGGLVILNEEGKPSRVTDALVPGYRRIDTKNTAVANYDENNWYDSNKPILTFTNPLTGKAEQAQRNRPGIDFINSNGFQNAAASLDGFNNTSAASAKRYNNCVFEGKIDGKDLCAATNGANKELFTQRGTQMTVSWDANDQMTFKYIYGHNKLSYQRTTDDDNTASEYHDRQFYVNHEAKYSSHEFQMFYDINENFNLTSGIFFYDAIIDQRGDYYSSIGEDRMRNEYEDKTKLSAAAAKLLGNANLEGLSFSTIAFQGAPMVNLYTAKNACKGANAAASCKPNYSLTDGTTAALNIKTSRWYGDNGTDRALDVTHGPRTVASDLLYATQTDRKAFAAYSQGAWDLSERFTLTLGLRYASDEVKGEENLWRYSETGGPNNGLMTLFGGLAAINRVNGGLVDDGTGALNKPTSKVTNGGVPYALSVYRPFKRKDTKTTGRINLDWDINDDVMMYFSITSGYRSGGYNLVFFSNTPTYQPEELISYEMGLKGRFMDNTLQINASAYNYDYKHIHTTVTEVSSIGGYTTSVVAVPGAKIQGLETEVLWLATDAFTLGMSASYTPSEYTKDYYAIDPANNERLSSLYPDFERLRLNIKGNQVLQMPEIKTNLWGTYKFMLSEGAKLELSGIYSWIDKVYYSPFESKREMADAYGRLDLRASWTSGSESWVVTGFINNVMNDIGVLQVVREGQNEFFRRSAGVTSPRMYGLEMTYNFAK